MNPEGYENVVYPSLDSAWKVLFENELYPDELALVDENARTSYQIRNPWGLRTKSYLFRDTKDYLQLRKNDRCVEDGTSIPPLTSTTTTPGDDLNGCFVVGVELFALNRTSTLESCLTIALYENSQKSSLD